MAINIGAKSDVCPQSGAVRTPLSTFALGLRIQRSVLRLKCSAEAIWNRASASALSARGHWKTKQRTVDFGPALQTFPDGSYKAESSTQARIRSIDSLLATRPWADIVDMQIFLDGFDAGEQWGRCRPDLD